MHQKAEMRKRLVVSVAVSCSFGEVRLSATRHRKKARQFVICRGSLVRVDIGRR